MLPDKKSVILGATRFFPFLPSVALFGLIFGFTAAAFSGLPLLLVSSMSYIIFAGSAQFFILLMIIEGEVGWVLVIAGIIINARHLLYSASVSSDITSGGIKKIVLGYLLTDEAYLVTTLVKNDLDRGMYKDQTICLEDVLLGSGFLLWAVWNGSTILGYLITPLIEDIIILSPEFVVAGSFLGFLIMQWLQGISERKFIAVMMIISFISSFWFQSTTLLILTLLMGMIIAMGQKYLENQLDEERSHTNIAVIQEDLTH